MSANILKFLDQGGVGTLWSAVASELEKKADAANVFTKQEVTQAIAAAAYDDSAVKASIKENTDAIAILNGASSVEGSVAFQIAKIVAGAGADFDTLKEIADWIAAHPESVTSLQSGITANAEAIEDLAKLVGSESVADQIATALENADFEQYALASDLTDLAGDLTALSGEFNTLKSTVNAHHEAVANYGQRIGDVETKANNNATAIAQASSRIDGLVAGGGEPNLINSIKVNGEIQTIAEDKSVDIAVPVVQALSTAEIKAACGIA